MGYIKILIDADACPVTSIVVRLARRRGIPVVLVTDTSHVMASDWAEIVTVGQGGDAVDLAIINRTEKGDVVVTQDYGLAALALGRKAHAIHQSGLIYTDENIGLLLAERHESRKVRRAGGRTGGFGKRTAEDDRRFEAAFMSLIEEQERE